MSTLGLNSSPLGDGINRTNLHWALFNPILRGLRPRWGVRVCSIHPSRSLASLTPAAWGCLACCVRCGELTVAELRCGAACHVVCRDDTYTYRMTATSCPDPRHPVANPHQPTPTPTPAPVPLECSVTTTTTSFWMLPFEFKVGLDGDAEQAAFYTMVLGWLIAAAVFGGAFKKTKKLWDYTCTLAVLHLVLCCIVNQGGPTEVCQPPPRAHTRTHSSSLKRTDALPHRAWGTHVSATRAVSRRGVRGSAACRGASSALWCRPACAF